MEVKIYYTNKWLNDMKTKSHQDYPCCVTFYLVRATRKHEATKYYNIILY
ncbi:hypothetical protein POKO110462_13245 [Pontibacter korlensis]